MRVLTRVILPIAVLTLLVDRLTKWYVVEVLDLPGQPGQRIDVFSPFFQLIMAWNEGINFGIPLGGPMVLIGLAVVISAALVIWSMRRGSTAIAAGAGLVVGGALGNAWDRASDWGAVADFLNVTCCGIDNRFSFNVADIAIFVGAVWIALRA